MALLEVQDLHVYYGNIEALRGISLHAEPGQIVAILGGNGAGKTTTLRTISGLLRPRSGSISCAGKSLVGVDAHVIVGMGVSHVPEGRRIFNILDVDENLALGGYLIRSQHQLIKERNAAVFELRPGYRALLMTADGLRGGGSDAVSERLLTDAEASARRQLGWHPSSRKASSRRCARSPIEAPLSYWSSRTRARRSPSRITPTSSRSGGSSSRVGPRYWPRTKGCRRLTLAASSPSGAPEPSDCPDYRGSSRFKSAVRLDYPAELKA